MRVARYPRDLILIVGLALVIWVAQSIRPRVMDFDCGVNPAACVPSAVVWPDRLTLGVRGGDSDIYSNYTQYAAGALAAIAPLIFGGWGAALEIVPFAVAALANSAVNEGVRLVAQRPRPYVYADPKALGHEETSYTSFYSGHTSFAAVAAVHLVLALRRRGARTWAVWTLGGFACVLVFLTALFRVLSGYHFMTDVLVGALIGALISYAVSRGRGSSARPE